jgi:hypothetical protein
VRYRADQHGVPCSNDGGGGPVEILMYIGGILGTVLVIVLILYLLRRI